MDSNAEKRAETRIPCDLKIQFTVEDNSPVVAQIVDISATGMGLLSETKLQKGQIVSFLKNQPQWELPESGQIVWSFSQESGCRAGLEFI